jgi:hypothetical protein
MPCARGRERLIAALRYPLLTCSAVPSDGLALTSWYVLAKPECESADE